MAKTMEKMMPKMTYSENHKWRRWMDRKDEHMEKMNVPRKWMGL